MESAEINARVDQSLKRTVEAFCRSRGLVVNQFVQEALINRLEELEDIEDIPKLRREPRRPFSDVLRELERDGEP